MATIGEMLIELAEVKQDLKDSITAKGQTVGNNFTTYADAIDDISTSESRASKVLVIITEDDPNETDFYEQYLCEEEGSLINRWEDAWKLYDGTNYTIKVEREAEEYYNNIGDNEQYYYINPSTGNREQCNSLEDGLERIYGTGNVISTDLTGVSLYDYINELQSTYDLTLLDYSKQTELIHYDYGCEPGGNDSQEYEDGYNAGYGDYPDYGITPNPYEEGTTEYEDWNAGYNVGYNQADSEQNVGDEPDPEGEDEPEPEE